MAYNTTSVLIFKDFKIRSLPTIPAAYINRIDPNVWKEFTDECAKRVNQTYSQNHDISTLASKRCCLQVAYIVCAPLVFILGYASYYCLVLAAALGAGILIIGAILAISAFAAFISAVVTATKCGSMMRGYRFACQQDLDGIFLYMNSRYNNLIYFSTARSTHRNNGTVQLGINIALRVQQLNISMANNSTNTNVLPVGQVMPVQVHGVPIQLANGQIVYQIAAPIQSGVPIQQQPIPIQQQQPIPIQQQQPIPIQQQQMQSTTIQIVQQHPPQYKPPPVNPQYNNNGEGEGLIVNQNGATEKYQ
eukprot:811535_1